MKILGMVCIRKGSKRFPGKNIALYKEKELYKYALEALSKSKHIKDVVLVHDYDKRKLKAPRTVKQILRTPEVSTDLTMLQETISWAYMEYAKALTDYDAICHLMATNPLITSTHIDKAIGLFRNKCNVVRSYDITGQENGLMIFKTELIDIDFFDTYLRYVDTHTGAITLPGLEIHTKEDLENLENGEKK